MSDKPAVGFSGLIDGMLGDRQSWTREDVSLLLSTVLTANSNTIQELIAARQSFQLAAGEAERRLGALMHAIWHLAMQQPGNVLKVEVERDAKPRPMVVDYDHDTRTFTFSALTGEPPAFGQDPHEKMN